jgi:hypothetical protein
MAGRQDTGAGRSSGWNNPISSPFTCHKTAPAVVVLFSTDEAHDILQSRQVFDLPQPRLEVTDIASPGPD